jgi:hypothetical protein
MSLFTIEHFPEFQNLWHFIFEVNTFGIEKQLACHNAKSLSLNGECRGLMCRFYAAAGIKVGFRRRSQNCQNENIDAGNPESHFDHHVFATNENGIPA